VLKVGLSAETRFVVGTSDLIDFAKAGLAPVLSTPALLWHLEQTAIQAFAPVLSVERLSLGAEFEFQHLAPTLEGRTVVCSARVIRVDGNRATFQLEAREGSTVIARGVHGRVVVRAASLARKLAGDGRAEHADADPV